jgi:Domain of unknown function (DUF4333)
MIQKFCQGRSRIFDRSNTHHGNIYHSNIHHSSFERQNCPCWAIGLLIILAGCTNSPDLATPPPSPSLSPNPTVSPSTAFSPPPLPSPTSSPNPTASPSPTSAPSPTSTASSTNKSAEVKTIETKLGELVAKEANISIQAIACPANLEQKAGTTYDCQVASDAGTFLVAVEPTGQSGQFRWSTKGLLLLGKLDQFLQQNAQTPDGGKVSVDCGGKIRPAKPGETFACKVTDSKGKTRTTKVTVKDDQGNVDISPLL